MLRIGKFFSKIAAFLLFLEKVAFVVSYKLELLDTQ